MAVIFSDDFTGTGSIRYSPIQVPPAGALEADSVWYVNDIPDPTFVRSPEGLRAGTTLDTAQKTLIAGLPFGEGGSSPWFYQNTEDGIRLTASVYFSSEITSGVELSLANAADSSYVYAFFEYSPGEIFAGTRRDFEANDNNITSTSLSDGLHDVRIELHRAGFSGDTVQMFVDDVEIYSSNNIDLFEPTTRVFYTSVVLFFNPIGAFTTIDSGTLMSSGVVFEGAGDLAPPPPTPDFWTRFDTTYEIV